MRKITGYLLFASPFILEAALLAYMIGPLKAGLTLAALAAVVAALIGIFSLAMRLIDG